MVADKKNYIFIDKIQEIEDFKVSIRSLALDDNNDIYITGSNSEMFSNDLANELGGLPYLIHLPLDEAVVMEYIRSVYSAIVVRDVVERKKIRNTAFLEQLIRFLTNNTGSLFSS